MLNIEELYDLCPSLNIVTSRGCVAYETGCCIGRFDLLTPCKLHSEIQAITASSLFPQFTVHRYTHTSVLSLLHSPLVVFWQRIRNSLTETSNHI
jgi:hypothetical protein